VVVNAPNSIAWTTRRVERTGGSSSAGIDYMLKREAKARQRQDRRQHRKEQIEIQPPRDASHARSGN